MAIVGYILLGVTLVLIITVPIALVVYFVYQLDVTHFKCDFDFQPPKGGSQNWKDWQKRQVIKILNGYRFAALANSQELGTLGTEDAYNNSMYERFKQLLGEAEIFGFMEEWLNTQDG